ncbi:MAG: hypothetical protein GXP32_10000 [Kiritimatiellaeota bacterium]|nr:hypothetical protein [Kiritimatiellota bacterium]
MRTRKLKFRTAILKKTLAILSFVAFFNSLALLAEERPLAKSIVMATLNGEPITLLDVLADTAPREKKLAMRYSGGRLKKKKAKLRREAIENIIDRRLVYTQFKQRKYKLPESIIERMLDGLAKSLAGGDRKLLEKKARDAGLTMKDLREQAMERAASSLLINERCSKSVYITPKQVYDYYVANRDEFTTPARLNLQAIFLKCASGDSTVARFAERLKKTLRSADEVKFAEYASLYSQGPNHKNGGRVGWIPETELRPEFIKFLTGAKPGSIHGPIKTPEGVYFIRVAKREESRSRSFESVKKNIRKNLTDDAKKKKYKQYSDSLRKFSVIRYFD